MIAHALKATGHIHTTFVMSLHRFIVDKPEPDRERFQKLQGSDAYARFLKQLEPNGRFFTIDPHENDLEEQGHALGVFRRRLLNNHFFPTYTLNNIEATQLTSSLHQQHPLPLPLNHCTYKLRLTRNGHVVVKMVWQVQAAPLPDITHTILQLQGGMALATPQTPLTQWELVMQVAGLFMTACGGQFMIEQEENGRLHQHPIRLTDQYERNPLPLHNRHITFLFSHLSTNGNTIPAAELRTSYAPQLLGLLQNSLIGQNGRFTYPTLRPQTINQLLQQDHANWEQELCLLTAETSLILCPPQPTTQTHLDGSGLIDHTTAYQNYWRSITRGIEYVIALKSDIQMIENATTQELATVPDLTAKVADGNLSQTDTQEILQMAQAIGILFHMLPKMRDVLVPSSIFRNSHAVAIFNYLMQLLGIHAIEHHIETNVQELNAFLAHYNNMQLQHDAQRTNAVVIVFTIAFSLLTILLSLIAIPSFFADGQTLGWFNPQVSANPIYIVPSGDYALGYGLLLILAILPLLVLVGWLSMRWATHRR